jgi:hypothetical protein
MDWGMTALCAKRISRKTNRSGLLACCRFGGHEDKIVTHEPESGYDETEVQPRVQD